MSMKVKERLKLMGIEITHEERLDVDKEIEDKTGVWCEYGVTLISDDDVKEIVDKVKKKKKKKILVYA